MTTEYDSFRSPNPHRLFRNTENGILFGVCAGVADYFGVAPWTMRLAAIAGGIFFTVPAVLAYIAAVIFLPRRPDRVYASGEEEVFWRSVSTAPDRTFSSLRHTFRDLEARLRDIERHVTSAEFNLARKFRDLEK